MVKTNPIYATTEATSKEDVDLMDKKQRLWDSLSYTYGKQQDASNKSYDAAISQQDNALLSRGMQRSSYGMQTLANLQNQKANALQDIGYAKIADYESRLQELEQQEQEQANWQASFDENKRQFDENLGYQKTSDERSLYYNYISAMAANGTDPTDEMLAKAGLTRADFNALKQQAKTSGSGGRSNGSKNPGSYSGIDEEVYKTLINPTTNDSSILGMMGGSEARSQTGSLGNGYGLRVSTSRYNNLYNNPNYGRRNN